MYELDFFGLISCGGIEFMTWLCCFMSLFTVMMGLVWPLVEMLFKRWDVEEMMEACREIDSELLEEVSNEIVLLERQEIGLIPLVRRREMLEYQIDHIWSTPICLT